MSQLLEIWEKSWDFENSEIDKNTFSTGIIFLEIIPFQNIIYELFDDKLIFINSNEKEAIPDIINDFLSLCVRIDVPNKILEFKGKSAIMHNRNLESSQLELIFFPVDSETIINSTDMISDVSYFTIIEKIKKKL